MKKHDYSKDIYYEDIEQKIFEQETILDGDSEKQASEQAEGQTVEQEPKTLETFTGEPKMDMQDHVRAYNANNPEAERIAAAVRAERYARINRQSLVLALVGLFLSLVFGLGIFFSIPAWVKAGVALKFTKSQTLSWAKNLGILGTFLNLFVIIAFIIIICV